MDQLADLLNHGILPFAGRSEEIERLMQFWRGTFEAQELRGALLIGEAGIGKSRLVDETLPDIVAAGGLALRVKIYPESESSIIALIAQGLWESEDARRLLKSEPRAVIPDVVVALRRLSRLRPTILVIEDLHLLKGESLREFSTLLNAIAEETLSLLCTARPVQMEARAALQRFVVEEIELEGFAEQDLESLWQGLFASASDRQLISPLLHATGGNPLALRSALRNAVRSRSLVRDAHARQWRAAISPEMFGRALLQEVGLLAEGMVSHLTEEEKQAAGRIASLGEIFSREAAAELLEDAESVLNHLVFKGIIAPVPTVTLPLPGATSAHPPLAFTHTLLHEHLMAESTIEPWMILRVIARDLPLYSISPFQLQLEKLEEGGSRLSAHEVEKAIRRIMMVAGHLDKGPRWEEAIGVWERGSEVIAAATGVVAPERHRVLEADVLFWRLTLSRRSLHSAEYRVRVERLLDLTSDSDSDEMIPYRLWAYYFLHVADSHSHYERCRATWERVDDFVREHPSLRSGNGYLYYLYDVAKSAWRVPDRPMVRLVEQRLQALLADQTIAPEMRRRAWELISPQLLHLFDSGEELQERLQLMRDLSAAASLHDPSAFLLWGITLLAEAGEVGEALGMIEEALVRFKANGNSRNIFQCSLVRLCAYGALGRDLDDIATSAGLLCTAAPEELRASFQRNAAIYLTEVGLLRGEMEWTRSIIKEFSPTTESYWAAFMILQALDDGDFSAALSAPDVQGNPTLETLLQLISLQDNAPQPATDAARSVLRNPILQVDDLMMLHVVLALVGHRSSGHPPLSDQLQAEVHAAISNGLEWLAAHGLFAYMPPLLERGREIIPKKVQTLWRARINELRKRWEEESEPSRHDAGLYITMLDDIATAEPGHAPEPIRGARQRTMLGLLTAAEILKRPLSPIEFRRIAAGDEIDPGLARKSANMAIVRLREAIGPEAIEMGEEIHRLNRTFVRVDLLDAMDALNEAVNALRDRALLRLKPAMARALDLAGGKVPFPGLYDDFFEALREDFETRMRNTLLDAARALLREGDGVGAEELLRRGFMSMPDDEEIADLLSQALVSLNQRTEAERVRMKIEEAMDA